MAGPSEGLEKGKSCDLLAKVRGKGPAQLTG